MLNEQEMASLTEELAKPAYAGLTDEERFVVLHRQASVPNPVPQGDVPRPFTLTELLGCLGPESLVRLKSVAGLPKLIEAVNANDRPACAAWNAFLLGSATTTAPEYAAIAAVLADTVPDPAWTETVVGPSPVRALFGGKSWTRQDGTVLNFLPVEVIAEAR